MVVDLLELLRRLPSLCPLTIYCWLDGYFKLFYIYSICLLLQLSPLLSDYLLISRAHADVDILP